MKANTMTLLEYLVHKAGCNYLSDLRRLGGADRIKIARVLEALPPDEAERREWNAALTYLTGAPLEMTAEAARARLIALLAADQKGGVYKG